jgi:hypothetical protein
MRSTATYASWDSEPEGALSLSRFSQGGGVQTLAERRVAQVMGCAAKTCSLFHSLLIKQALDLTLQPRNSTLATLSPVLKGLSLLADGRVGSSAHKSRPLEEGQSRKTLRLNRGCRDFCLVNGSAAGGPDFGEAVYMG